MQRKEIIAMLLAGGEGRRLGALTQKLAKPAVPFGGKYRIIDFTLSNCSNSGIDTVGVLTQYQPLILNSYLGIGSPWDLDRSNGGVTVLPPYVQSDGGHWYKGTANAIFQNIFYIERYNPQYILVISGDHIYKMDYDKMLQEHKKRGAEATIALIEVPWEETGRFGIMNVDAHDNILDFEEKPKNAKTNLASMGIYIFNWDVLKSYLTRDDENPYSSHDFGKDIIPRMLQEERSLFAYRFKDYWKDVGTIESLWEANMDLLEAFPTLNLHDTEWRIYSVNPNHPPQYIAPQGSAKQSLINEGCMVFGSVDHSVLFYGVQVGDKSTIRDSIIMPNVKIGQNVKIYKTIIGEGTVIGDNCTIGVEGADAPITLIGEDSFIPSNTKVKN
ncbi:glucose-1-phosphate adenylyltransferase [Tumebacillus permanentifrigoris]|uniref:Glucose-1-phosphate adenylyltransferase n=1 Tax=Tumebacillus permanentifrigoris TaxID=378543 RepID=A0A316D5L5_9BACL|nr:glucose-1-phosphate adenylyltransferase [Tumebacillus permanentifrigoris]PWK09033.1 glucose-1-phosphate adenylyltransferase [Tumebacillus permanentifrigoris]